MIYKKLPCNLQGNFFAFLMMKKCVGFIGLVIVIGFLTGALFS